MTATLFDTTPAWVLDTLHLHGLPARRGQGTITTHRRTRATPRWHPCGQPVWTGLCDRQDVTLDPTPTTVDGELFAILAGRRTYQLTPFHYEIERRHPAHITYADADTVRVYIAHQCGGPYPIVNDKWASAPKTEIDNPPF
jgi:hypothetical protein